MMLRSATSIHKQEDETIRGREQENKKNARGVTEERRLTGPNLEGQVRRKLNAEGFRVVDTARWKNAGRILVRH